ncbi:MAG: hypothetical protein HQL31_13400 [Planctomycetes bacterium]|nr:hypothetical protein [Planctomycetota bacterium]
MATEKLSSLRNELKSVLKEYATPSKPTVSEDDALISEANFAASNLSNKDSAEKIKAIQFLELLNENPFAQHHLVKVLDDRDNSVIAKAIAALGRVGRSEVLPKMREKMANIKSRQMTAELARVIGKIEKQQDR